MNVIENKVAIGDEVFIVETKYDDKSYNVSIYHNGAEKYPIFSRESIIFNKTDNIEDLHSKVLAKFIKTYKKNRGDMKIINTILSKLLSFKEKDSKKDTETIKINKPKNITSDEILKSCNKFLDNDISAIVIAQDTNVIFIDGESQIDKDKILHILQYIYQILQNNKKSIKNIIGDISTMYLSLSTCQIVISPIDDNRVCMIISKNKSSIGNLYKKAENIFKHSKELF